MRLFSNGEVSAWLASRGLVRKQIEQELQDKGYHSTEKVQGKEKIVFYLHRWIGGKRVRIGLLRYWTSLTSAKEHDGFSIEKFVDRALSIPSDEDPGIRQSKIDFVQRCYSYVDSLQSVQSVYHPVRPAADVDEEEELTEIEAMALKKKKRSSMQHPVHELFLQDMLKGMGMSREAVLRHYTTEDNEADVQVTLEDRLTNLHKKIAKTTTTFTQYIRPLNLYLLWANVQYPAMWKDDGLILVNWKSAFNFMQALENGEIGLYGDEPPISQVLDGETVYELKPKTTGLSPSNARKYLSALTFLHNCQLDLLDMPKGKTFRMYPTLRNWEKNHTKAFQKEKNKRNKGRQRLVIASECPLAIKLRQSTFWLNQSKAGAGMPYADRNRAFTLAQTFSVSRFSDCASWQLADMTSLVYGASLPSTGETDIRVIYMIQGDHKSISDNSVPDLKLLVRHRQLLLCPLSAIAMMFFRRFVMEGEQFPRLHNSDNWFTTPIFKGETRNGISRGLTGGTMRDQRLIMMEATKTLSKGRVNHQDRHLGTMICRMSNIANSELEPLGLWSGGSVMTQYYAKYADVDTISKLAGFKNGSEYKVDRDLPDMQAFRTEYGGGDLFDIFYDDLWSERYKDEVIRQCARDDSTAANVLEALKLLGEIFWKDLPHYYDINPDMEVFSCAAIQENWDKFMEWREYCKNSISLRSIRVGPDPSGSMLKEWQLALTSVIQDTRAIALAAATRVDRLVHLLETGQPASRTAKYRMSEAPPVIGEKRRTPDSVSDQNEDEIQVVEGDMEINNPRGKNTKMMTMRPLRSMSIWDLWVEWTDHVVSEGVKWPSLRQLESERKEMNKRKKACEEGDYYCYRVLSLRTTIERRARIGRFLEHKIAEVGSEELALQITNNLMVEINKSKGITDGTACSLYAFSEYILHSQQGKVTQ